MRLLQNVIRKKRNIHIFRIGIDAGFFSEYNNMILAYLYCLENGIDFSLYSENANFSFDKGWEDYFLPFCPKVTDPIHNQINIRGHHKMSRKNKLRTLLFKLRHQQISLTHDLWFKYRDWSFAKQKFGERSLDLQEAAGELVKQTWRYNEATQKEITARINSLNLPDQYLGLHIRGGDKFIEAKLMEINSYIDKIESLSDIKSIFLLTDDYRVVDSLRALRPAWDIYTFCRAEERGYFHDQFEKVNSEQRKEDHLKLFSSIEVLANAAFFVGTYTSNPGMYLGMRMGKDRCFGVDAPEWLLMW